MDHLNLSTPLYFVHQVVQKTIVIFDRALLGKWHLCARQWVNLKRQYSIWLNIDWLFKTLEPSRILPIRESTVPIENRSSNWGGSHVPFEEASRKTTARRFTITIFHRSSIYCWANKETCKPINRGWLPVKGFGTLDNFINITFRFIWKNI